MQGRSVIRRGERSFKEEFGCRSENILVSPQPKDFVS